MQRAEAHRLRKALAGLVSFLSRHPAILDAACAGPEADRLELRRSDGARRKVDAGLLRAALARGLVEERKPGGTVDEKRRNYVATGDGRAALRRWLADPETAFQDQHRTIASASDPDHGALRVNTDESPLAALARLKGRDGVPFLDPAHVDAGERLRSDFTRGHLQPSLGQRWEPLGTGRRPGEAGGAVELGEAALAARQRIETALEAVGPELSGVLIDVCCFLKRLSEVERERQWPARSAKLMLRTALAALARHYAGPRRNPRRRPSAPPPRAP